MNEEPMDDEEILGRVDFALASLNEIRQHLTDLDEARTIADDAFQKLFPVWEELKREPS